MFLKVSPEMLKTTQGLCGYYNENCKDDFKTAGGTIVETVDEFAKAWLADSKCISHFYYYLYN